ncbi:hypothetical protein [Anabaena azotica]|uniref:hypothetical protein n=1 Tax=Anabaena azotica TaxID=197653 RepID=UPI0039A63B5D
MGLIQQIVKQVLDKGYLSLEAENELRKLLSGTYDLEDLNAFFKLQQSAMDGHIKQISREK